jgi:hypothetical protein
MIEKRRQRVRRAVPTIRIPQADRTTHIPRAAQHPPRHQGRAVRAERAAELDRIPVQCRLLVQDNTQEGSVDMETAIVPNET